VSSFTQQKKQSMTSEDIMKYFGDLNAELAAENIRGELALVGGAVMCLVFKSREATIDVDAVFEPKMKLYECAKKVAEKNGLNDGWLNDSVKGYISVSGEFKLFNEMSHIKIFSASAEYMLAMKCLSSRTDNINEINDIKFLLSHLALADVEQAIEVITKFYPAKQFLPKTKYLLQELIEKGVHAP